MSEKIWAQENHPLAPAGPDTPKQEWESSGAYDLGPAYYDTEPDELHDSELADQADEREARYEREEREAGS